MERPSDLNTHNESQFSALVECLQTDSPIQALAVFDDSSFRDELLESAINAREDLQPVLLDLSKTQVESLRDALKEKVPLELQAAKELYALIHIANLEGSLLGEIISGEAKLIADLAQNGATSNEGNVSYQSLYWIDQHLYQLIEKEAPDFLANMAGIFHFFNPRKNVKETPYAELADLSKQLSESAEGAEQGPTLARIGQILEAALRSQEASVYFQKALEAGTLSENEKVLADCYAGFGNLMMAEQDMAQAIDNYEIALEKYITLEETLAEAEVRNRLARILSQMGDLSGAIKHQQVAFKTYRSSEDQREAGLNGKRLAYFYEKRGDLDAAAKTYTLAAKIYDTIDDPYEVALCHQQCGAIRENQLQPTEALTAFTAALEAAKISKNEYLIAALEDSVEDLQTKLKKKTHKTSTPKEDDGKGRRGFFKKLFGN
ncbi:MAG: hypothetical protein AAF927_20645 [Bacteroidota bacterium]